MSDYVNGEEMEILKHTHKNGRFNGSGESIDSLVRKGLLKCTGRPSWVPESYYVLTARGLVLLKSFNDPNYLKIGVHQ